MLEKAVSKHVEERGLLAVEVATAPCFRVVEGLNQRLPGVDFRERRHTNRHEDVLVILPSWSSYRRS
jgi:hypothetical protein